MIKTLRTGFAAALLALVAVPAFATNFDLQSVGAIQTDGTAYFFQGGELSGTGVFPAFVQIAGSGPGTTKSAYNTTVNNVLNNGSSDTFNHELTLAQVGIETYNGVQYYRFLLDINENNNASDKYLSLDEIQIYTSTSPNQSTTTVSSLGDLRYDLDASGDNAILLDYSLNPGSGKFDMKLLVPVSAFSLDSTTEYVYLFSQFGSLGTTLIAGRDYGTSDGFEEWAVNFTPISCVEQPDRPECQEIPEVPEPATLALLGTGLAALAIGMRKLRA